MFDLLSSTGFEIWEYFLFPVAMYWDEVYVERGWIGGVGWPSECYVCLMILEEELEVEEGKLFAKLCYCF